MARNLVILKNNATFQSETNLLTGNESIIHHYYILITIRYGL
jgi:hypothetical protein